jgi:hypothetical protein
MDTQSFNARITEELTATELALINTNIYYNTKYSYHTNYHLGKYDKCYAFLMSHRHLLTINHTPKKWRELANHFIRSAKIIYQKE